MGGVEGNLSLDLGESGLGLCELGLVGLELLVEGGQLVLEVLEIPLVSVDGLLESVDLGGESDDLLLRWSLVVLKGGEVGSGSVQSVLKGDELSVVPGEIILGIGISDIEL